MWQRGRAARELGIEGGPGSEGLLSGGPSGTLSRDDGRDNVRGAGGSSVVAKRLCRSVTAASSLMKRDIASVGGRRAAVARVSAEEGRYLGGGPMRSCASFAFRRPLNVRTCFRVAFAFHVYSRKVEARYGSGPLRGRSLGIRYERTNGNRQADKQAQPFLRRVRAGRRDHGEGVRGCGGY